MLPSTRALQLLAVLIFCLVLPAKSFSAIQPGQGKGWLTVGSRDNPSSAISVARQLTKNFSSVHVFRSSNGWYAITLGWMATGPGNIYKNQLISRGLIPGDSYFTNGNRFLSLHWSTSGVTGSSRQRVLAATALADRGSSQSSQGSDSRQGFVTGLKRTGDNYLSVRTKPSRRGREIARLRSNTPVTILGQSSGWYQIRTSSGQTGWSFGKYIRLGEASQPQPQPQPKPQIIVDNSEDGLELVVSGLRSSGDDFLSLRRGPGTQHREVARLRPKTRLTVTGKANGWYRVKPNQSVEGWVSAKYVSAFNVPVLGPEKDEVVEDKEDVAVVEPDQKDPPKPVKPEEPKDEGTIPDERRVALVLGNSAYEHTVELANPKNDADRISTRLEALGFEVIVGLDGDKASMEKSVRDFVRILPNSDVALFFYAGHAMQVNGGNYLIPVDAKLADSTAVDFETINLASILSFIDEPGRISIALLDACRDNPLSRSFAKALGPSRSAFLGRGLASPTTGGGNILIGFATAPGEVALDGEGENSPFTTALLNHMSTPKVEIELMLKKVKAEVYDVTGGRQAPWHNSGLRKEFYFKQ